MKTKDVQDDTDAQVRKMFKKVTKMLDKQHVRYSPDELFRLVIIIGLDFGPKEIADAYINARNRSYADAELN